MPETAPWHAGEPDGWRRFLEGTAARAPLPFFARAMLYVDGDSGRDRLAIDLGCGGGADTFALLERGWRVHSVDASPTSQRLIAERLDPEYEGRVTVEIGRFDELDLPQADLVYAQMSLPFSGSDLESSTANALDAVRPGGAFAVHFFGSDDEWIDEVNVAYVNRRWIEEQFGEFVDVTIDEVNQEGPYGLEGGLKRWHYYFALAKR